MCEDECFKSHLLVQVQLQQCAGVSVLRQVCHRARRRQHQPYRFVDVYTESRVHQDHFIHLEYSSALSHINHTAPSKQNQGPLLLLIAACQDNPLCQGSPVLTSSRGCTITSCCRAVRLMNVSCTRARNGRNATIAVVSALLMCSLENSLACSLSLVLVSELHCYTLFALARSHATCRACRSTKIY